VAGVAYRAPMPELWEIIKYSSIFAACVLMVFVVRARRKQHQQYTSDLADSEVCEHLKPVLDELRRRGYTVRLVKLGQEDQPVEIFLTPEFEAAQVQAEMKLQPPVFLSERGVLYCQECWCEMSGVNW
jgi:hypothetical protein